ncbi:MAG: SGNH/GDSL hydrolase family protein [Clostridiales bacterium]|nr:SGNH/GDSL hydrolase family protein [Clostridiales bacterium]
MKKFLTILCSITLLCGLVACGKDADTVIYMQPSSESSQQISDDEKAVQLLAPKGLRDDNGILKWGIVENASGYLVTVGAEEFQVFANFMNLDDLNLSNGNYEVKVCALGNGRYTSSAYSDAITITIAKEVISETTYPLETPVNLSCENDVLRWDIVNNASGYVVALGADEFKTPTNFLNLEYVNVANGTYEAKVCAVGGGQFTPSSYSETITITVEKEENVVAGIQTQGGKNQFDLSKATGGYLVDGSGYVAESEWYVTSDFIPVTAGESVAITGTTNRFLAYTEDKTPIAESYENLGSGEINKIYEPTVDGFIRISIQAANMHNVMIAYSDVCSVYEPVRNVIESGVYLNETQIQEQIVPVAGNVLYGKKWVACGDSFTAGDFTNAPAGEQNTFTDQPYFGKNKVYPFFIGRRNSMRIVNEAVSGSTMAKSGAGAGYFSAENGRYTQIPADTDYITLWFGINDEHHNVPIGEIDDATNETFYGAWNVVMEYLITNHPKAKIGIVITNGCLNTAYPKATRDIARRWGVGYLDINGDYKVPLMLRVSEKTEIPDSVHQLITKRQSVLYGTNGHPNAAAHEYQSTFIEAWLRTL